MNFGPPDQNSQDQNSPDRSLNTRKETDILYKFLQKSLHPAPLWSPSLLPLLESYSNVDHMPVVITPNNFACMVSIQRVCTCVGGGAKI